jgi:hypothetical protein
MRSCIVLCLCEAFSFFSRVLERSLHAPFIVSRRRRVTKILERGAILAGEAAPRPQGGLIRWRRGLYYGDMVSVLLALLLHVQACVPLLREWFLYFGIVVTCPIIPGPIVGMAYSSLWFGWRRGPRPRGAGIAVRSYPECGNSAPGRLIRTLHRHKSCV